MIINNMHYKLIINDKNGSLESFNNGYKEFILDGAERRPVFSIRLRDLKGKFIDLNAHDADSFLLDQEKDKTSIKIKMFYRSIGHLSLNVHIGITCPYDESFTYWNLSVNHDTEYYIEYIDFPDVVVPNDLIATGGSARILWPAMEGVLIEDADLREESWLKYTPIGYPSKGWEGYYPGPCPCQFMAYYDKNGGLYLGAHDEECNVKSVEFYKYGKGIRLEFRLFPGAIYKGNYNIGYNMVLGVFSGDWHDAADIYRNWLEKSKIRRIPKLYENNMLPGWMKESPIVVIYPVRGKKDTGDMTPNEYFPYINILPYIEKLSEYFDSKILALIMHWEGTAPWAPPYVWPPFGGEECFAQFVNKLHEKGNLSGVYCSGIAWTDESVLVPEYKRRRQLEEQNLLEIMCASPEGDVHNSLICNGPIRWGYDMCPSNRFVVDVVIDEVTKIIKSGCDYIQYFDQNLGGASYFCYSKNHGHPPAPGRWQKDAMVELFQRLHKLIKELGKEVVIGCESAAAEPYIQYLLFNDLRYSINFFYGRPVPMYAYINHEYINNFMGNQNQACKIIDLEKSPDNLLFRIAYSFIAGDMLSVVLRDKGKINWDWGTDWDVAEPDQNSIITFIRNLNAWRKNAAMPFLYFGRMEKPYEIKDTYDMKLILYNGKEHTYPSLLTSRWISPGGRNAQIVVNYTRNEQEFTITSKYIDGKKIKIYNSPDRQEDINIAKADRSEIKHKIGPLNATMFEII